MLTKKEMAEFLKVSEVTLNRMLADGMPRLKVRGSVRFIKEDIIEWLRKENGYEDRN